MRNYTDNISNQTLSYKVIARPSSNLHNIRKILEDTGEKGNVVYTTAFDKALTKIQENFLKYSG